MARSGVLWLVLAAAACLAVFWAVGMPPAADPSKDAGQTLPRAGAVEGAAPVTKDDAKQPVPVEVDTPREHAVGSASAPLSPASPLLTLPGVARSWIGKLACGTDRDVYTPGWPIEDLLRSQAINPRSLELDSAATADLQRMIEEMTVRDRNLWAAEAQLCRAALFRSVETGRLEAQERTTDSKLDEERGLRWHTNMVGKYGRYGSDWTGVSIGSTEPDGVSRTLVVWMTRVDSPEVFEARDRLVEHRKDAEQAFRAFFAAR
jgi:hypothetical protein